MASRYFISPVGVAHFIQAVAILLSAYKANKKFRFSSLIIKYAYIWLRSSQRDAAIDK